MLRRIQAHTVLRVVVSAAVSRAGSSLLGGRSSRAAEGRVADRPVCARPRATVTTHGRRGWDRRQSAFPGAGSQRHSLAAPEGHLLQAPRSFRGCRQPLGLQKPCPVCASVLTPCSPWCMPGPGSSHKDTSHVGRGPTPPQRGLILANYICGHRTCTRGHSLRRGLRISTSAWISERTVRLRHLCGGQDLAAALWPPLKPVCT